MDAQEAFDKLVKNYPPTKADIQDKDAMDIEEEPQFTHPAYDPTIETQTLVRN